MSGTNEVSNRGHSRGWWRSGYWDTVCCRYWVRAPQHFPTLGVRGREVIIPQSTISAGRGKGTLAPVQEGRRVSDSLFGLCGQRSFIRLLLISICRHCVCRQEKQPTVFSTGFSRGAKDTGWTGRVKQLPSTIRSCVTSRWQKSTSEWWLLTPFCDTKDYQVTRPKIKLKENKLSCQSFKLRSSYIESYSHFD